MKKHGNRIFGSLNMFACKCTCLTNSSQSCSTSCLAQAVGITSECGAYGTFLAFVAFRLKIAGGLHAYDNGAVRYTYMYSTYMCNDVLIV